MNPTFKLFLNNQRINKTEHKPKLKNAKSFRMRTHQVPEQSKDLSARQCNLTSCQITTNAAPNTTNSKELIEKLNICGSGQQKNLGNCGKQQEKGVEIEHSYFKAAFSNREPLRFLKPELRYRNESQSVIGRKNQLYRQINNPKIHRQSSSKAKLIQYSTEYTAEGEPVKPLKTQKSKSARVSLNVLRSKLKSHFRN